MKPQVVRFSTNKGLETIKYDRIIDLNPVWNQRYFTYADAKNGFIEMNQTYSLDNFNAPSGESITKTAVVRFVKMNGQIDNTPAPKSAVRLNGTRWEFDVPTLDPKQIYVAQILLCWKNNKAVNMENTVLSKANVTKFVQNGNNYERTEQQLNGDKLRAVGNEKVLYNINFKTSQYANYTLKITKFEIP